MFKLEDCDFEIDKSFRFSFENDVLNFDVSGDQSVFDDLTEDESHPFSWALYPPRFYINLKKAVENNNSSGVQVKQRLWQIVAFTQKVSATIQLSTLNIGTIEIF